MARYCVEIVQDKDNTVMQRVWVSTKQEAKHIATMPIGAGHTARVVKVGK